MLFDSPGPACCRRCLFRQHLVIAPATKHRIVDGAAGQRIPTSRSSASRAWPASWSRYTHAATGVDAVALDTGVTWPSPPPCSRPRVATQGNLDPLALVAGGEALQG